MPSSGRIGQLPKAPPFSAETGFLWACPERCELPFLRSKSLALEARPRQLSWSNYFTIKENRLQVDQHPLRKADPNARYYILDENIDAVSCRSQPAIFTSAGNAFAPATSMHPS